MIPTKVDYLRLYCRLFGPAGLKLALVSFFWKQPRPIRLFSPALRHEICLRTRSSDILVYEKIFLREEYRFPFTDSPRVIVDAGANIGLSSIYLARQYPGCVVYAVEPEPSNYALLVENTRRYPSIKPVQAALWGTDTPLEIVSGPGGYWGFQTRPSNRLSASIPGLSMPTFLDQFQIPMVDLLKLDVEGAEIEILSAASSWVGRIGNLWIELHDRLRPGCTEALAALQPHFPFHQTQGENILLMKSR